MPDVVSGGQVATIGTADRYRPAAHPEVYVGLDPGTSFGWAVCPARPMGSTGHEPAIGSGTWDLRVRTGEGGGMRYLRLRALLRTLLADTRPVAVGYELVRRHEGTVAAQVYGGLVAIVTSVCEEIGVPYHPVNVADVKRKATGKGNAGKPAMLDAAQARWPAARVATPDEADALWIAECVVDLLDLPF